MTIRRTPAAAQDSDPSLLEEVSYLAWHLASAPERSPHVGGPPVLGGVVHGCSPAYQERDTLYRAVWSALSGTRRRVPSACAG